MTTTATQVAGEVTCTTHPALGTLLERVRHEAMTVPRDWVTAYSGFQSGGWGTLSLLNATSDPRDVTISDTDPVSTTLLDQMPATAALLAELALPCWWARLAMMRPGACLWEHRDYTEPGIAGTERYRVHLPLVTSPAAFLVIGSHAVHMSAGRIWRFTPAHAHAAINAAGPARIHLILDCHPGAGLSRLAADPPADCVRDLPTATPAELARHASTAHALADLGYPDAAELHLLRLPFSRVLPAEGHAYDMITQMHAARGDSAAAGAWQDRKAVVLGEASR